MNRKHTLTAAFLVLLLSTGVAADPVKPCADGGICHLRMREDSTLIDYDGTQYSLPPGRFIGEGTYQLIDNEFKRLQDQETRLQAENDSFRKSADVWRPSWVVLTAAILVGVAGGIGGYYWYDHR